MRLKLNRFPRLALSALALVCACAAGPFQRADALFAAGDMTGAAAAYDAAAPAGATAWTARALFRAGTARATPGTASYDPAAAIRVFTELRSRFPSSSYAPLAALPLALLGQAQKLIADRDDLQAKLARAEASLKEENESNEKGTAALKETLTQRQVEAQALKARLAEVEASLRRLQKELEQLKHIDLNVDVPAKP